MTRFILLQIDMSFSLSGIDEHTNGVMAIKDTKEEMDAYVKDHNIILDKQILLYHLNYEAYTVVEFNDIESRVCRTCAYYNGAYCVEDELSGVFDGFMFHETFGCNKWRCDD